MDSPATAPRLSTGSFGLDLALGGGAPPGGLIELYGPSESGKTTLALGLARHTQAQGREVAWIDADHTFDPAHARRRGLDLARLLLARPAWLEAGLEMAEALCAGPSVGLIVLDGLDALPAQSERLHPTLSPPDSNWQASPQLSPWLRRVGGCLRRWQTGLVITHGGLQPPGGPVSRAYHELADNLGRLALPLQAGLRLKLEPLGHLRQGRQIVGERVRVSIVKYSLKPCLSAAEFDIMYSQGVLRSSEVFDLGIRLGLIQRQGSGYGFEQVNLGSERRAAIAGLEETAALQARLEQAISQALPRL